MEKKTLIVWGMGCCLSCNSAQMGEADKEDFAQVQDRAFQAGVTDREGNLMHSDCWVVTMLATEADEAHLDSDAAVLGYCTAAPR